MLFLSCFLCFNARLFVDALCSPALKGLTSWLSFVISNCYPGLVVELYCIDSRSLPSFLLFYKILK